MLTNKTLSSNLCVKDVDFKSRIVTGYFASWDIDLSNEQFQKGAFARTINSNAYVAHLLFHDTKRAIGLPTLKEDDYGLYFSSKITKGVDGDDTLKKYEEGIYKQHSVGFLKIKNHVKVGDEGQTIFTSVHLIEGSTVVHGDNPNTPFMGFKSREAMTTHIKTLRKVLSESSMSDEALNLLNIELKKLEGAYEELKEKYSILLEENNLILKNSGAIEHNTNKDRSNDLIEFMRSEYSK